MKIELDVQIPDGYEATGEYRPPRTGEWFFDHGCARCYDGRRGLSYIILRKKRWRAEQGCKYFAVWCTGEAVVVTEAGHRTDDATYAAHNYFRTKEEAEAAAVWVKALLLSLHEKGR